MKSDALTRLLSDLDLCIVDLGARDGVDEDMLAIATAIHVIGFEPDPVEAERLARRGDKRWRKVTILPFAIGGSVGPATLHVPASSEGASLLPHNPAMAELFGYDNLHLDCSEVPVRVDTLDSLSVAGNLPRVDSLKIDIEGAELDVLKAATKVLRECVAIKVECSFLEQRIGQPLIWEVAQFLIDHHFCAVDIIDPKRWRRRNLPAHPLRSRFAMSYSRGQLAQCDLVFLKHHDAIDKPEQALRLVLLAATLGHFDFAITVLRAHAGLNARVRQDRGFNLEHELQCWSRQMGRQQSRRAIVRTLRSLVPLLRSAVGLLPHKEPNRPY